MAFPFFNPDVFWHLAAGRWIWTHHAVPRADAFSFTRYGASWIDFEWLTQALWYAVDRAAGLWGLWALKIVLLAAAFIPIDGLLRDKGATPLARAAAAALWGGAALGVADVRPDLASLIFFGVLLRRLESGRASFRFGFVLFALWCNLHAGFVFGFALYALYAAVAFRRGRSMGGVAAEAVGAALGCLLNPYGLGLFSVYFAHASGPSVKRYVMEWAPPTWRHSFQIPLVALLFAVLAALVARLSLRRRMPAELTAATALFGAAAAFSARFGGFFASSVSALAFCVFPDPPAVAVALGLAALTPMIPVFQNRWTYPFHSNYVARRAVTFVAREKATLGGLRLFNQYEWGGDMDWRLGPDWRVFDDGRYLFAGLLAQTQVALESPRSLDEFASRWRLDGFLIADYPNMAETVRVERDGTRREMPRPWHILFFPRARWALIYWDDQALLYVDRAKVPADWLAAHEYRWRHPGDDAALADALAHGEVPRAALAAEDARHAAEIAARPY